MKRQAGQSQDHFAFSLEKQLSRGLHLGDWDQESMNVVVATRVEQSDMEGKSSTTVSPGLTGSKGLGQKEPSPSRRGDRKWREVRKGMFQAELVMSA